MSRRGKSSITVGQVVRASWPPLSPCSTQRTLHESTKGRRRRRRVLVLAEVHDGNSNTSIFQVTPQIEAPGSTNNVLSATIPRDNSDADQDFNVDSTDVEPLLSFESSDNKVNDFLTWKDQGDEVLRLGDAWTAVEYYRKACCCCCCSCAVGGTALLLRGNNVDVVDVDCVNETDVDVTVVSSGEEVAVSVDALLGVHPTEQVAQVKLLLNLARALVQVGEASSSPSARPRFLRCAYQTCTLVIRIQEADGDDNEEECNVTLRTAFVLRCSIYERLCLYQYALADAKRVLQLRGTADADRRRLERLERQRISHARADRKLVKEMCRWVQGRVDGNVQNNGREIVAGPIKEASQNSTPQPTKNRKAIARLAQPIETGNLNIMSSLSASFWFQLVAGVVLIILVQRLIGL